MASPTPSPSPSSPPSDTSAPVLTSVRDAPDPFSPNGDGTKDVTKIFWTSDEPATTNVAIYRRSGKRVRSLGTFELEAGSWSMKWNGCNAAGQVVKAGTYVYEITATDGAGNTSYRKGRVTIRS
ncbi:MAG: gliding motility-associated C-terminal domain-containing protein [Actinomycetota bacterium]|nr:gliding motility-associated C-terminal domain-containing protein [Actinomycetota bacterium]